MRFMIIVKANHASEAGALPSRELVDAMYRFNEEMTKAGVLLAAEGLHPSSTGSRLRFTKGKKVLIDGPFAETKELVAGFWLIQVNSRQEALEWASRCPPPMGEGEDAELEIREVYDVCPGEAAHEELQHQAAKS